MSYHLPHPDIWTMWFALVVAIGVCVDWFLRAWDYWYITLVNYSRVQIVSIYPQWFYKQVYVQLGRVQVEIYYRSFKRERRPR